MTPRILRARLLAPPIAVLLAAGSFAALTASPATAASTTFTQSSPINLGDTGFPVVGQPIAIPAAGTLGAANPYPSQVTFPSHPGTITDVNLTLNLTSTAPLDLDILLVAPSGQARLVMSDAGGGTVPQTSSTFTLDDEAPAFVPDSFPVDGASYKPTNNFSPDAFDPPAPASTGTTLAGFDGLNPSGAWKLFVMDDQATDTHTISSWTLRVAVGTVPSPSTLAVNGLPSVTDVDVSIHGFTSTFSDDVDLLLVGPGGQQATIMSDSGDGTDVSGLDLTFDDEAPTTLPDEALPAPIGSGSYQPSNFEGTDSFPGFGTSTGTTSLTVFDGLSPNGTWSLYAVDDANDDLTTIASWSLRFTWSDIASPTGLVNINGGAPTTSSPSVTLNVNATDPAPASGVTQMRFSNDGTTFSAYQPYATSAAWTLSAGDGAKTVYAQFRDAEGNQSAVVSDTITLALPDTTGPTVTKTTPKKNATGVKVTTKVKVKVSEALKGSTVTKKTVFLKAKGSSDKVKAKVTYNSSKKMIVLTPTKALKKSKKYNVTVTTKVKDVAGNALDARPGKSGAQALKFSFTTA